MNETEHSFPLPDVEQHKLDEVKEELVHPPIRRRFHRTIHDHIWKWAGLALVAGVVSGFLTGRTNG